MKKIRWNKVFALVLSLVLLASTVSASGYTLDLSGDGKVDVWDVQVAVNEKKGAAHEEAILDNILGGGDELHPNAEGVYEIWSATGLYNMAQLAETGASFKLMADIDMQGADWTPVASFKGTFDGNLHTISNLKITKLSGIDMGLFAKIGYGEKSVNKPTVVKNLNLANVDLTIAEGSQYAGLLVGSNWGGVIENCTATGVITDSRTVLAKQMYIGALAGRNANSTVPGPGTIASGTNLITAQDAAGNAIAGLSAQVALDLAKLDDSNSNTRHIGIAGYSNVNNIDKNMTWQDVTNATSRLSATEQQRRQIVVDTMYEMGTVQWTPSELVTFTRNGETTNTHSNIYIPGVTYTGVPYVGGLNGSYDRFLSQMQTEKDDQGRYVTVTGLEDGECNDGVASGMSRYMGNNCIHAISWSWMQISPSRVANNNGAIYGGVVTRGSSRMVPNAYNTPQYGILSTGGYKELPNNAERYPMASDARNTQKVIELNGGAEGMAEYFTFAHKGDALTHAVDTRDETTGAYSSTSNHARMLADDPVIIRKYNGKIDLEASYVLTHEQGDGLFDNRNAQGQYDTYKDDQGRTFKLKQTSWRINHKYTLSVLLTKEGYDAAKASGNHPGCGWGYIPITMRAFTGDGPEKKPYYDAGYTDHPLVLPNSGWYYSNFWIENATMVITDADGNELYNETRFLLDRGEGGFQNLKLEQEFPDSGDKLTAGQTYYCTLMIKASNGIVTTKLDKQEFIYNPAT